MTDKKYRLLTAFGNQALQDYLKKSMPDAEFAADDFQYQEALLDALMDFKTEALIINASLEGPHDFLSLLQLIRNSDRELNIVPVFKARPDEELQERLEVRGVKFILIDNSFNIGDIYRSIRAERDLRILEASPAACSKKNPENPSLIASLPNPVHPLTIAVSGSRKGVGCTHAAISVALYLSSIKSSRVAFAELNGSGDIKRLGQDLKHISETCFILDRVHFHFDTPVSRLIHSREYSHIVLDLGTICTRNEKGLAEPVKSRGSPAADMLQELERAGLRICICQVKPWQADEAMLLMDNSLPGINTSDFKFCFSLTGRKTFEEIRREFPGKQLFNLPYRPELQEKSTETEKVLENVLKIWYKRCASEAQKSRAYINCPQ